MQMLNKAIIWRIFMGVKYERLSYLLCIVSVHLLYQRQNCIITLYCVRTSHFYLMGCSQKHFLFLQISVLIVMEKYIHPQWDFIRRVGRCYSHCIQIMVIWNDNCETKLKIKHILLYKCMLTENIKCLWLMCSYCCKNMNNASISSEEFIGILKIVECEKKQIMILFAHTF